MGVADFEHARFLYNSDGECWRLFAPGREYVGGFDEWEMVRTATAVIAAEEPIWLLEILSGAVEVVEDGTESILGENCSRYLATVRFADAAAVCSRELAPPTTVRGLDADKIPLRVWLDDAGRARRVELKLGRGRTALEPSQFGIPKPVELPDPSEVWANPHDESA